MGEYGFDELLHLSKPSAFCSVSKVGFSNLGALDTNLEEVGLFGRVFLVKFSSEPPEDGAEHFQILC